MNKLSLLRYSVWLFAFRMAYPIVAILVAMFLNFELGSSGISVIAPMFAAMIAGQRYGNQHGELIPPHEVNRFSRAALLVAILAEIVTSFAWGYIFMGNQFFEFITAAASADGKILMLAVFLIMIAMGYFAIRWGVTIGAKSALKAKLKQPAKGQ
ncbi:hypothetical protein RA27_16910 [Ruegeria sp. ANG-R]|uniref:ABZJ_00895 family protein n=1 Tax=Ruegeria sp. ANG-R TaxID=1577903 RepID=UPI00057E712F|nr:ABZJ_00895 family protein [Ruegeria sp. ANG-R]KIC39975.1 hypothetical protein RA27_16910 [Ruegeria sp. ANG-R]